MTTVPWPVCAGEPCSGIRVEGFNQCLAHLTTDELDQALGRLEHGGDLDVRGTTMNANVLAKLMKSVHYFGDVAFERAQFEGVEKLGPLVARTLALDGASFDRHVEIEVSATQLTCTDTRFEHGAIIRASKAVIIAERTYFGAPSLITESAVILPVGVILPWQAAWDERRLAAGLGGAWPALVSLRGTDVSNLVLVEVDLSWCLFAGAHKLDQLRIEGFCWFNSPPRRWLRTRRNVLADEYLERWGSKHPFIKGTEIAAERTTALYRSLRKALEDSKNEAGAGDFYYGEMESRRRSFGTSPAESLILHGYWLLSGYGQRAGRAVAALGVLVAIVCILLFVVGLPGGVDWHWARIGQSLRIGMGAVVFREAGQTLTSAGSWTVMVARFAGPVLLALALLAVRARVKR